MNQHDDEIFNSFLEESREHLSTIEEDFVELETQGENLNDDLINKVFRAIHTIKGSAGFFSLHNIKNLAHVMENLLGKIRNHELIFTSDCTTLLLEGADLLKIMLDNIDSISSYDPEPVIHKLSMIVSSATKDDAKKEPALIGKTIEASDNLFNQVVLSNNQLKMLQQAEKGGQFVYMIVWNLQMHGSVPDLNIMETVSELVQYAAFMPAQIIPGKEMNCFERSCQLVVTFSTVVEPALIYDILTIDKKLIKVVCDKPVELAEAPKNETVQEIKSTEETVPASDSVKAKAERHEDSAHHSRAKTESGSIRVNLEQLDKLMTLAGELVLARNALLRKVHDQENPLLTSISQQIDNITSELQEAIMSTRMQSVGIIFTKFKRIVRDLSRTLNKKIDLSIEGVDVELDKTIVEALNDPLTHLVRNSADHGIELPAMRVAAGKSETGHLSLTARHEAGHVIIEISDDGAGIDPDRIRAKALEKKMITKEEAAALGDREMIRFIFKPGFSTAEKITDVSGRGVGLDVVLSNLTKVGGAVDIESKAGKGTKITLKLPLTLAIIPSILVSVGKERFAIPQLNVVELVRIAAVDVKKRIEKIGDSAVIRLRGVLVPLVRLADILTVDKKYLDKDTNGELDDRRSHIADRRSPDAEITEEKSMQTKSDHRTSGDRRKSRSSAVNIIIVTSGVLRFGLIIDQFLDSEEIVVKPIGSHLKGCIEYAGATILGDGSVSLILNIAGISTSANLTQMQQEIESVETRRKKSLESGRDAQSYLVVRNNNEEQFAIPLGVIARIERFKASTISSIAGQCALAYGESSLALLSIENLINVKARTAGSDVFVVVFRAYGRDVGVMVSQVIDIVDLSSNIDISTYVKPGISGSVIIDGKISLILDLFAFVDIGLPEYKIVGRKTAIPGRKVLIVEDSPFFLRQLKAILTDNECDVVTATNGEEGLSALHENADAIGLCFTDIEMPVMDGVEMTRKIRSDSRFRELPIIAVSSLSGENAEKRAREAGISEYLIKLDREQIVERCKQYL